MGVVTVRGHEDLGDSQRRQVEPITDGRTPKARALTPKTSQPRLVLVMGDVRRRGRVLPRHTAPTAINANAVHTMRVGSDPVTGIVAGLTSARAVAEATLGSTLDDTVAVLVTEPAVFARVMTTMVQRSPKASAWRRQVSMGPSAVHPSGVD